ncbi:MAG: heavy-metal-associated domain-containing protein [Tomitella sp.]|nr:heavy-metal-associated domain-containing protein [Tomitella sp.]
MSTTSTYRVTGMTCGGCAGKVTGQVEQIPGVTAVDIDLPTGSITVTSDAPVSGDAVGQAVEQAGYQLAAD